MTWLPFVTDVTNYYWTVLLVFELLIPRRPIIGYGFAAMIVVFTGLGPIYRHTGLGLYYFGSVALVLFLVWIAVLFAWSKIARLRGVVAAV